MKWHKLVLRCPECQEEPLVTDISSSADGEILVEMYCAKCQSPLLMKTSGQRLATQALYADIEERVQVQPKQIEAPKEEFNDNDWLHDLGIGGDE